MTYPRPLDGAVRTVRTRLDDNAVVVEIRGDGRIPTVIRFTTEDIEHLHQACLDQDAHRAGRDRIHSPAQPQALRLVTA